MAGFILMDVSRLELDSVHFRMAAQQRYVLSPEHRSLPEVGPEVMREHAPFDVGRLYRPPVKSDRLH
jgi:hypothetical protein